MVVRPLQIQDFNKGYVQLLSQLTATGNVNQTDFESKSQQLFQWNKTKYLFDKLLMNTCKTIT